MCQQWFSVAGQSFDVVGFLLIAWEWRSVFVQEKLERRKEMFELPEEPVEVVINPNDPAPSKQEMKNFVSFLERSFKWEFRDRMLLFYGGAALVIVGFVLQVVGSLPASVSGLTTSQ